MKRLQSATDNQTGQSPQGANYNKKGVSTCDKRGKIEIDSGVQSNVVKQFNRINGVNGNYLEYVHVGIFCIVQNENA